MELTGKFIFDDNKSSKIIETINYIEKNTKEKPDFFKQIYTEYVSHKIINKYEIIIYFTDIFVIKYFNKIFIFNDKIECSKIDKILFNFKDLKKYINNNSVGLILNNKLLSNEDFSNLKKCYMLTEKMYFNENGKICCKYKPYYIIELELVGSMLMITIDVARSFCELNMKNVNCDLKTFLNKILKDIDKKDMKIYHEILQYYSTLKDD